MYIVIFVLCITYHENDEGASTYMLFDRSVCIVYEAGVCAYKVRSDKEEGKVL